MSQIKKEKVSNIPLIVEKVLKTSSGFESLWCYLLKISAVSDRVQVAGTLLSTGYSRSTY